MLSLEQSVFVVVVVVLVTDNRISYPNSRPKFTPTLNPNPLRFTSRGGKPSLTFPAIVGVVESPTGKGLVAR